MNDSDMSDEHIMGNLAKTIGVFAVLTAIMAVTIYALTG
jgi:hypothetical protein